MKKKAIIVIGCSLLQIPIMQAAKKIGFSILLTDSNPDSPGKKFCDEFKNIRGNDVEALKDFAAENLERYEILSVYCGSDFGLKALAELTDFLSIGGPSINSVAIALDKFKSKELFLQNNIPTPKGRLIKKNDSFQLANFSFPLIVKPIDGSGSRGVQYVNDEIGLEIAISLAREISPDVIIEEALDGSHFDVSGFFAGDIFYRGGQLERFFSELPDRYPIWGFQPPSISQETQTEIYNLLEHSARVLGINYGPVKADIIYTSAGPYVLEVTPRFHGDVSTSFVCQIVYGYSPPELWFKWLFSGTIPNRKDFSIPKSIGGWIGIFAPKTGYISSIHGIEEFKSPNFSSQVILRKEINDQIDSVKDNTAIVGFGFSSSNTVKSLKKNLFKIRDSINIKMRNKK